MLVGKKKQLASIVEWLDKVHEDASAWTFEKEIVRVGGSNTALNLWSIWRLSGHWPLGNWLEQPLSLLVQIEAIDLTYQTWREYRHNDKQPERPRGLASMNATQLEIVRVFENE